ncbi:4-hydroxy-tetrahydrodipicolinate synthase [candidate division NPL-UPA2 bacterium]|nr:4-hydroxy-tetrahydrodipicolinate synthase [candidate division NPL-UPA2 bacterium]
MERLKFEGTWTALVTPLREDGKIDWEGFEKNVRFQISQGVSGLLPVGTTGESPTLGWEEHNEVIAKTIQFAKEKCYVMAGTGSNSTEEALAGTRYAVEAGADAVLLVDCYYNGPSSLELRKEYHGVVAKKFPRIQVVPYIIPGRSGTALSPEDLAILAKEFSNVRAVKEATGDLERMIKERRLVGNDFDILSGDDDLTFEMMTRPGIRASGVVSVISNVVPGAVEEMVRKTLAGDSRGGDLRDALSPLFGIVTVKVEDERTFPDGSKVAVEDKFRNPLPLKTLMNGLGMSAGPCRRPLGRMSPNGVQVVRSAVRTIWEKNPEILRPIEDAYGVKIEERLEKDEYWNKLAYN